ncbi:MAG: haloacid dehalogenase-like hydrolase [Planctomycetota bacterium]
MKACLFDIDGTLVMTGGAGQQAFAETFAEEFGVDQISQGVSFAGRSDRAIAMDLFGLHGVDPSQASWDRFQSGYLDRLAAALDRCVGEVLPGVTAVIDALERRGDVLIGLLTGNVRTAARQKLEHYGLWDRFENGRPAIGGFGDDFVDRNDIAAAAVAEARGRHGRPTSPADETIVIIGDTPNDIRCARSVEAKAVAVPTGHTPASELRQHTPDLLLDTLEDAEALLAWFDD